MRLALGALGIQNGFIAGILPRRRQVGLDSVGNLG